MKTYTEEEFEALTAEQLMQQHASIQEEDGGQIVIYLKLFAWHDGTYRDEPEGVRGRKS